MAQFIRWYDNAPAPDICRDIIASFDADPRKIGGQSSWHIDCNSAQNHSRALAAQWYFNDVAEGGATAFADQKVAVPCVEGRLALFPVAWTYRHRGSPPVSGPKYVCTTIIHPRF